MNKFTTRTLLRMFHYMVQEYQSKVLFTRPENFDEMVDEIEEIIINHTSKSEISSL